MSTPVEIAFDCLPLRTIGRFDVPLDASPEFRARCKRLKQAIERHGQHNSYYLLNARCVFHLTNDPATGMLEFALEGTVLTDADDRRTRQVDLAVEFVAETCDWLTRDVTEWFAETARRAVAVEFDRYIAAGSLDETKARLARLEAENASSGGFLGMYL